MSVTFLKEQLGSHWTDFHEIWYLGIFFRSSVENFQVPLKSDKNNRYFTWRPIYIFNHLAHFLLEWKMFQTKAVEKIKTHILCSIRFFRKSCRLWDNVEKYGTAGQDTDYNMAHAHCMLDTSSYKHTHRICNNGCTNRPQCYVTRTLPVLFLKRNRQVKERILCLAWK